MRKLLKLFSWIILSSYSITVVSCEIISNERQTKVYLDMVNINNVKSGIEKSEVEKSINLDITSLFNRLSISIPELNTDYLISYSDNAFTSDNKSIVNSKVYITAVSSSELLLGKTEVRVEE
ncbi:hypothetical protein SCORR_v1c06110 [Spiroplasma corruscae]|uniref:Lipoprotein n=1 Tax=Spiroplasma corruscae TaxID=216934 RepID=A0A222EQ60_9MOLU|nr:hypothetical protein [Spiroplasma corruscae]ASP28383.1 hypothetical protein SCORR_v1c06110 [Spiroplasma corruscae]